jgi:hypothetical protein
MTATVLAWLKQIPDAEVRTKALNRLKRTKNSRIKVISIAQALMSAFYWGETPEGHRYWESIAVDIQKNVELNTIIKPKKK